MTISVDGRRFGGHLELVAESSTKERNMTGTIWISSAAAGAVLLSLCGAARAGGNQYSSGTLLSDGHCVAKYSASSHMKSRLSGVLTRWHIDSNRERPPW
jgi:hypothetical protein